MFFTYRLIVLWLSLSGVLAISPLSLSTAAWANNGADITPAHPLYSPLQSVVPLYRSPEAFARAKALLPPGEDPSANCSATLINRGRHALTAAHCVRDFCPLEGRNRQTTRNPQRFILYAGRKHFVSNYHIPEAYCYHRFVQPYADKLKPNPLFPEVYYDIAVLDLDQAVRDPHLQFFELPHNSSRVGDHIVVAGYGVAEKFMLITPRKDQDQDGIHDYFDLCPHTTVILNAQDLLNKAAHLASNGCSAQQTPLDPPIARSYFESQKLKRLRAFWSRRLPVQEWFMRQYRMYQKERLFTIKGQRGSLQGDFSAITFSGDSGAPYIDLTRRQIVAVNSHANYGGGHSAKGPNGDIQTELRSLYANGIDLAHPEIQDFLTRALKAP